LGHRLISFVVPVLLGKIVGGTVLFTLISHAQVISEILDRHPADPIKLQN
jgi:formate/nitrite transporter FocA (FNT family)